MTTNLPSFQRYQLAFTARIRDPLNQPPLDGVPRQRMAVYEEIVFNNLFESVSACFPVARKVLGKRAWLKLTQAFLREYPAHNPLFRKIPEQFLEFITNIGGELQQSLPPYLISLCHYEWIELFVASTPATENNSENIRLADDLGKYQPVFTATMQLLDYEYAVHKISPRYKPKQKESTQLLVYRDADDNVKFVELNAVTFRLIALLQGAITGEQALALLANELKHLQAESIIQFGLEILNDLKNQGIIIGVRH